MLYLLYLFLIIEDLLPIHCVGAPPPFPLLRSNKLANPLGTKTTNALMMLFCLAQIVCFAVINWCEKWPRERQRERKRERLGPLTHPHTNKPRERESERERRWLHLEPSRFSEYPLNYCCAALAHAHRATCASETPAVLLRWKYKQRKKKHTRTGPTNFLRLFPTRHSS